MRAVVQRTKKASVGVNGKIVSTIGKGFLVLLGVFTDDTEEQALDMAIKISKLRVMDDNSGKLNLNISDVGGEILSVSQFTLAASTHEGNRPGFSSAARGPVARGIWEKFNEKLRDIGISVKEGVFGADMEVELINDGPVTFVIDMERKDIAKQGSF